MVLFPFVLVSKSDLGGYPIDLLRLRDACPHCLVVIENSKFTPEKGSRLVHVDLLTAMAVQTKDACGVYRNVCQNSDSVLDCEKAVLQANRLQKDVTAWCCMLGVSSFAFVNQSVKGRCSTCTLTTFCLFVQLHMSETSPQFELHLHCRLRAALTAAKRADVSESEIASRILGCRHECLLGALSMFLHFPSI